MYRFLESTADQYMIRAVTTVTRQIVESCSLLLFELFVIDVCNQRSLWVRRTKLLFFLVGSLVGEKSYCV
jgi:hypothetical protein